MTARIIISEFMDGAAVDRLKAAHKTHYDPALVDQPDELKKLTSDAQVLIVRNRTQVRGAVLEAARNLTCVGRLGVGLDNIDTAACAERNITVYPATGANDLSVAEYVIATAMILLRGAYGATADVIAGKWPRQALIGGELSGRAIGLVGFGAIAREVAHRARALGMTVNAYDPHLPATHDAWRLAHRLSLEDLLAASDVISLHVPLNAETRNLLDAAAFARLKPGAVIINAARGGVLDEAALCDALRKGRLAGAALDVFETEPLTEDAGRKFSGLSNLILTPHIAGVTDESNVRVSSLIADLVLQHLEQIS